MINTVFRCLSVNASGTDLLIQSSFDNLQEFLLLTIPVKLPGSPIPRLPTRLMQSTPILIPRPYTTCQGLDIPRFVYESRFTDCFHDRTLSERSRCNNRISRQKIRKNLVRQAELAVFADRLLQCQTNVEF